MGNIKKMYSYTINEDKEKLNMYYQTKDIKIRNELVEKYKVLVEFMVDNFSRKNNLNKEDVIGFAYQGLILGLEDYKKDKKSEYYHYLTARIAQYLDIALIRLKTNSFMESNIIKIINKTIKEYEFLKGKSIQDNEKVLNDIVDKIYLKTKINKSTILNYIKINIIQIPLNRNIYYEPNYYEAYNSFAKDLIKKAINKLSPIEKRIIEYIYGYYDGNYYTLKEITNFENFSISRIHSIKKTALNKLKSMPEIEKLNGILEIYDKKERDNYKLKRRRGQV